MINTLIHGAGRMARRVLAQLPEKENYVLAGVVSRTQPEDELAGEWHASLEAFKASADLLIDFTLPEGTQKAAQWCALNGVALLSGTTGLSEEDILVLRQAALKVPVLWAPNLSHGVALMAELIQRAAGALGASANITITDIHHQHKVDAPSGTALALAAAVIEGRSERLVDLLDPVRLEGQSSDADGELVFSSIRENDVVGEHIVRFELPDEVIEVRHKAIDREVFAKGALKAGEWLVQQQPGYYSTSDWLDLWEGEDGST
ncbi:MAG: 4-hydroxy-tetrahydrodipicolinate reductase [Gammaproteobacteria bacterium]|nr:MAG: 4-hydroxy-tetrahydrodipicolinate reductase [Gammaproteobacteria bacterium]